MKNKLPQGLQGAADPTLPAPTEEEKVTPEDANYSSVSPDPAARCAACENFVEPDRCLVVAGVINPMGVSDFFTPSGHDGGAEFEEPLPTTEESTDV